MLGQGTDGLVALLSLSLHEALTLVQLLCAGDVVLQILDGKRQSGHALLKLGLLHELEVAASRGEEDVAEALEHVQAGSKRSLGLLHQSPGVDVQADRDEVAEERKVGEVGDAVQLVQQHGQLKQRVEAGVCSLVHLGRHGVEAVVDVSQARVRLPVELLRGLGGELELAWQLGADSLGTQAAFGDDLLADGGVVRDVECVQQVPELPLDLSRLLLIGDPDVDEELVALHVPLLIDDSDRFE